MNIHETEGNSLTVVLPERLLKRNLAEQSKWINDPDPRPWVVHETQTIQWQMDWQKRCLARSA